MNLLFKWLLVAFVTVAVLGCTSTPSATSEDRLAITPSDFAVDVTVLAPKVKPMEPTPARLQCRYVLFANGSLHYAPDPDHANSQDWLPPLARILTRQQMAQLWSLTNQLGFSRDKVHGEVANFKLVEPVASDEVAFLAGFMADGHRWTIERRSPMNQPDPAMNELVNALARLAWASDAATGPVKMQPIRYDFGPDPYQRYRSAGSNP